MISSDANDVVFTALGKVKRELGPVVKGLENTFFGSSYMGLDDILATLQPLLEKSGLYVTQWPDQTSSGEPALSTLLVHESGQWIRSTAALALSKKDPQAVGSALTYMKRYALVGIFSIKGVDPDDDGNLATQPDSKVTRQGRVADDTNASSEVVRLRKELESAARTAGLTSAQLTKGYHDRNGVDYKKDTDETHLSAAVAELGLRAK